MKKANKLRSEIDSLVQDLQSVDEKRYQFADVRVTAKAGILCALASELSEISSRRLIRLTWALVILTIALLVYTVALYRDARQKYDSDKAADKAAATMR